MSLIQVLEYGKINQGYLLMNTTQNQILERLQLLPEKMLSEVLLFVDFLLSRRKSSEKISPDSKPAFAQALNKFLAQVEAEGSDIEERDFFAHVRDRTPASEEARWGMVRFLWCGETNSASSAPLR